MTAVTWFDGSTNERHSALSIPHFTFRIPHSAIPHFTHYRLAPFRRYSGLKVENRQFVPTPPSFNALARVTPFEFRDELDIVRN